MNGMNIKTEQDQKMFLSKRIGCHLRIVKKRLIGKITGIVEIKVIQLKSRYKKWKKEIFCLVLKKIEENSKNKKQKLRKEKQSGSKAS